MDLSDLGARRRRAMSEYRRQIGAAFVLAWMAVVILAAWPGIVRPGFLDDVHDRATTTLRFFGMMAGQPLFRTVANPWKQHGYCLFLRSSSDGRMLFPPEGECQVMGVHLRLPPVARATHRMLSSAWESADGGTRRSEESDAYVASVGRAFCRMSDPQPAALEAAWIWYYRNYDDGRVLRRNGAIFDYSCEGEQLDDLTWHPGDPAVVEHWGQAPW